MSSREALLESYLLDLVEEFSLLSRRASNLAEETHEVSGSDQGGGKRTGDERSPSPNGYC